VSDASPIRAAAKAPARSRGHPRLNAIRELALARWRTFYREPGTMFWTFVFPVIMSIVLGVAFRARAPEPVLVAVPDGPGAAQVVRILEKSGEVRVRLLPQREAEESLRTGKVSVLVSPATPGRGPVTGAVRDTTLRFDPARPESRLGRAIVFDAIERGSGRADIASVKDELVTEPGARYIDFLIPGLVGMGLMSSGLWGIGFSLAEMRTRKLLKRLVATPMRRSDFLLSFMVVRAGLLVIELPPLLLFSYFVFDVGIRGSIASLAVVSLIGATTFAMLGLLVASRAENPQIVSGLINVLSFPMYLCSGVFFSSANFPGWSQPLIGALPLTALIDALRAVMIEGAGLSKLLAPIGIMAVWTVGSFIAAMKLFRWR
jgi:ABC-type multidrug transport system permease subunit